MGADNRTSVNLADLRAIDLKPAVFYFASRRCHAGEELVDVGRDLRLTPAQIEYVRERL